MLITEHPLVHRPPARDAESGAVVEFWGVVRREEDGREIDGIAYEAHGAMAQHQLELIARAAVADFSLNQFEVEHRLGFVAAGEASLFVRVTSARRGRAFEASRWAIEELKLRVPIWKRPVFSNR